MTLDLPAPINASEVEEWSDEVDVVVVGFGIAGACAALEAARAGARVILLERAAEYGGTSAMAGGHFYLGGGTAVQQATGVEDSAEEMFKYLMAVSLEPDEEKIRAFCEDSVEHFDWIEALGMQFERSLYEKKAVIQPGTEGLMFTGNEKVHPFRDLAKPAPRGHKVPSPGDTGGAKMVLDALAERIAETDVDVRYETGAANLVVQQVNRRGRSQVVGVAWRKYDERGVHPGEGGRHRGRWLRRQRQDDRGVHPAARLQAVPTRLHLRRRARHQAGCIGRAPSCGSWSRPSSPRRSTRRPSSSPASW